MSRSDFSFVLPLRVRFSEVDMHGHAHNSHYVTYFEMAVTAFLRSLGYDRITKIDPHGPAFLVKRNAVDHHGPIRFDDEIEVCARIGRVGNSSVQFVLEIHSKGKDALLASGEVVWVHFDLGTRKTVPLPPEFVALAEKAARPA